MFRRLMLACALCGAARGNAQTVVRGGGDGPVANYWAGVSMGIQEGYTIDDGKSSSNWDFAAGQQFALTVERSLTPGMSVGFQFGHSSTNLTYTAEASQSGTITSPCSIPCSATATVNQYLAVFHGGTGFSLHQVFEAAAGFTTFSGFTAEATGFTLPPNSAEVAPTFELGYGFGYAMSDRTLIELVEEGQAIFPAKPAAGASQPFLLTTRISFRVGF